METEEIRKQIHGYIDKADDRFVNLVHAMMVADLEETGFELSDENERILDERLKLHIQDPDSGSTMEEAFTRINKQL
jgi:hypothetical protein